MEIKFKKEKKEISWGTDLGYDSCQNCSGGYRRYGEYWYNDKIVLCGLCFENYESNKIRQGWKKEEVNTLFQKLICDFEGCEKEPEFVGKRKPVLYQKFCEIHKKILFEDTEFNNYFTKLKKNG